MSSEVSHAEYMVGALSSGLRDGEWGACGAYSEIPMGAFMLARAFHAPNLWWMSGGGGAINPACTLVESSSDIRTWDGAEATFTIEDIVDYEFGGWQRRPNVGLFGGIQVDRRGNVNMVGIGDYPNLTLRGPGTVGLAFASHFHRSMIYLHDHNPLVLCEKVDYVSGPGHGDDRRSDHAGGPSRVVTPQAVFEFSDDGYAKLASITPGHSEAEVREHTGFEFEAADGLGETPAPSAAELEHLHTVIDPEGRLKHVSLGEWS
jgi:glutaconate CoA-transferase subunit B